MLATSISEVPALDYDDNWPSQQEEYVDIVPKRPRRTNPNDEARSLYLRWESLLPSLEIPYLQFLTEATGRPSYTYPTIPNLPSLCTQRCVPKAAKVLCLFQDCRCMFLPVILLFNCIQRLRRKNSDILSMCFPAVCSRPTRPLSDSTAFSSRRVIYTPPRLLSSIIRTFL